MSQTIFLNVKAAFNVSWSNLSSYENCQWLQTILDIHKSFVVSHSCQLSHFEHVVMESWQVK